MRRPHVALPGSTPECWKRKLELVFSNMTMADFLAIRIILSVLERGHLLPFRPNPSNILSCVVCGTNPPNFDVNTTSQPDSDRGGQFQERCARVFRVWSPICFPWPLSRTKVDRYPPRIQYVKLTKGREPTRVRKKTTNPHDKTKSTDL